MLPSRLFESAAFLTILTVSVLSYAAVQEKKSLDPIPIDLAVTGASGMQYYSIPKLSPDGLWVAYADAVGGDNVAYNGKLTYSDTGVPQIYGPRTRIALLNTKTHKTLLIGGKASWSWAPVWSLNGAKLAYYSDEGGKARVWVWDRASGESHALTSTARPFSREETVRWSEDGHHMLCKLLPSNLTLSQANSFDKTESSASTLTPSIPFKKTDPDQPSVFVYSTHDDASAPKINPYTAYRQDARSTMADLVVVDTQTGSTKTIPESKQARWYQYSPDGRYIAYAEFVDWAASGWSERDSLVVFDTHTGASKTLAHDLSIYGDGCSWAPNSSRLACVLTRFEGNDYSSMRSDLAIYALDGGERKIAKNLKVIQGYGSTNSALWAPDSLHLYVIGTDETPRKEVMWYYLQHSRLWKASLDDSDARVLIDVDGKQVVSLLTSDGRTPWTSANGDAWIFTHAMGKHLGRGRSSDLSTVDLDKGVVERKLTLNTEYWGYSTIAEKAHTILYTATSLKNPQAMWLYDTESGASRKISELSSVWDNYQLGDGKMLDYQDAEGRRLRAGLLLPPGYRHQQKLPLVVFLFGYDSDSEAINNFGIFGSSAASYNMHVLATRGYAVLHPDLALRPGTQMQDVLQSAIPAVNAAISQGYVDPDRMALMGYSIGSFSALALALQSDRFKAISIGGIDVVPDLYSSYLYANPMAGDASSYDESSYNLAMDGANPWDKPEKFTNNSLAVFFDRLHTPLLMGQGTGDGLFISNVIYGGLRRLHKEVEYRIYENEDHSISKGPNTVDFWQRRLDFYDEHLDIVRDSRGHVVYDADRPRSRRTAAERAAPPQTVLLDRGSR